MWQRLQRQKNSAGSVTEKEPPLGPAKRRHPVLEGRPRESIRAFHPKGLRPLAARERTPPLTDEQGRGRDTAAAAMATTARKLLFATASLGARTSFKVPRRNVSTAATGRRIQNFPAEGVGSKQTSRKLAYVTAYAVLQASLNIAGCSAGGPLDRHRGPREHSTLHVQKKEAKVSYLRKTSSVPSEWIRGKSYPKNLCDCGRLARQISSSPPQKRAKMRKVRQRVCCSIFGQMASFSLRKFA